MAPQSGGWHLALGSPTDLHLIATMPDAVLADALIDKVLAGERVTREDARALYRLPLVELGELRVIAGQSVFGVWSAGSFFPLGDLAGETA